MTTAKSARLHMFEISADEIKTLVCRFYAKVRVHPVLGPVFNAAIVNWPEHEAKIASFWRGAILREPGYSGNPMQAHLANMDVQAEHFPVWIDLFETTAHQVLQPEAALAFSHLARRIGNGLSFGLENFRREAGSPPVLT